MIGPVLLVASTLPGSPGIGGTVLAELLKLRPAGSIVPLCLPSFGDQSGIAKSILAKAFGFHNQRLARFRTFRLEAEATSIENEANRRGASAIWLIANSPEIIAIGQKLIAHGRDIRLLVWDDPEYLALNLRLGKVAREELQEDFKRLICGANKVAVVSAGMAERYRSIYNVNPLVLRHPVNPDQCFTRTAKSVEAPVRVAFAGSLYSKVEWNAFVSAISGHQGPLSGRTVEMHYVGRFPVTGARRSKGMKNHGQVSHAQALSLLATMDVGYLPYWFDARHEIVARTSFPGKLTAYTEAGLAIFNHSPQYTEATSFLRKYPYGLSCHSLDPSHIRSALSNLIEVVDAPELTLARCEAIEGPFSREDASNVLRLLTDIEHQK